MPAPVPRLAANLMSCKETDLKRITGKLPTECDACHGTGHTRESEPCMRYAQHPEHGTIELGTLTDTFTRKPLVGSGCLKCGGTGQLR